MTGDNEVLSAVFAEKAAAEKVKVSLQGSNLESEADLTFGPEWAGVYRNLFGFPYGYDKDKEIYFKAKTLDTKVEWELRLVPLTLITVAIGKSGEVLCASIIGQDCYGVLFLVAFSFGGIGNKKCHLRKLEPGERETFLRFKHFSSHTRGYA